MVLPLSSSDVTEELEAGILVCHNCHEFVSYSPVIAGNSYTVQFQKIRKFGYLKADVTKAVDLQVGRFKDESTQEYFIW